MNHKQNSNDHLNFKIYSDLLSFFNKYYQNYLQNETDMKKWEVFCMKYNDQFPVFWMKFTTLTHKVEVLFNNIFGQSLDLLVCQLWRKLPSWLTEAHLIANYDLWDLDQFGQFYKWLNQSYYNVVSDIFWYERHCQ